MHTVAVAYPRPRTRTRLDYAFRSLLRAVMADGWRPEKAANELLASVHDDRRVLRLLRARLSRAMLERPSRITERARVTVDHALTRPITQPHDGSVVPRQGGTHV